jgi:hypothetical protein
MTFFLLKKKTSDKLLRLRFQNYIKIETRHEKNPTNILIILIKV